jgi:hypothetical protein
MELWRRLPLVELLFIAHRVMVARDSLLSRSYSDAVTSIQLMKAY